MTNTQAQPSPPVHPFGLGCVAWAYSVVAVGVHRNLGNHYRGASDMGAIRLRKEIEGEWLLIVSGLLSVVFGIVMLVQPGAGALALVWRPGA